ncbi:MAG: cell division protein ZapA (FtsZ GTPase activity inhibitor) [Bradymonadia bacterium]|jgi:cell division protein ZapA (FtsZ GTPase activity inhibitor)
MSVRPVTLNIAGEKIGIHTDASDDQLTELSRVVEERLSAIRGGAKTAPQHKINMLAALSFAQELEVARREKLEAEQELERLRRTALGHSQGALEFLKDASSAG